MKVAIYARVSTKDQTADMQLESLRKYAIAREWEVSAEYVDEGYSGASMNRPQLDSLLNDARKRKFDVVAVWRFDRFARSTKQLLAHMLEFRALGIQFVSYSENIDTSTPMGEAMFTILAAFGQLERDIIRERVTTRVQQLIASGKTWGAPKKIWRRDQALADLQAGQSLRAVAAKHGISHTTLAREAKNKVSQ
ncbi:MAG: tnpR [Acidobacteriaceae bacterium]|nr:tnpR [Acidobacteriaceae bacterium]